MCKLPDPAKKTTNYNVLDFGAIGDGKTNDTGAIQSAIDCCAQCGGGRIIFPGGHTFRSGSIVLRSFVELHLEAGAVLKASDELSDFCLFGGNSPAADAQAGPSYANSDYSGSPTLYFLYGKSCTNVAITGLGRIDGNETIFHGKTTRWHIDGAFYPRMPLMYLEDITQLTLHQITLQNSAFWTVHMVGCNDVLIDGIRILNNLRMGSSDGIDPDHCKNVRIVNCHVECADDCIVLKNTENAGKYGACENIVVQGCTLKSTSAAIKIGTESEGAFRNIVVQGCNISGTNRGISLQLRDSGYIENALFSNINIETRRFSPEHWWGSGEPIAITALPRRETTALGYIRNVRFENINCRGENGILIYGHGAKHIRSLSFRGVTLTLCKRTDWPRNEHDLRPSCTVQCVKDAPYYVYAKGAENVSFCDFWTDADAAVAPELRDVFCVEDCQDFRCPNDAASFCQ